ncbi:30S ribosomal protein S18 [Candidatus Daviesbacteria bacterium]|nr:30S ribosomal protein S18 [Candidatus Daviesbacteria bacterium]
MAEKRKITKKVILKKVVKIQEGDGKTSAEKAPQKRGCNFCQNERSSSSNKIFPAYTDIATLKRYISDRGKIVPRARSGVCSKHQRQVTKGIKHARHLALLPFSQKV